MFQNVPQQIATSSCVMSSPTNELLACVGLYYFFIFDRVATMASQRFRYIMAGRTLFSSLGLTFCNKDHDKGQSPFI